MYRTRKRRTGPDLSGLTELRVHGVGGSSPEQFLDVPYTDHVAGDLTAGFFAAPDDPTRVPPRRLEAYSWGGLTSRSRLRALWLLLLPFALVNLAGWMADRGRTAAEMEAAGNQPKAVPLSSRISVAALRIVGLVATATAVLYVAVAGIDLYAYQCGANACSDPDRWLAWPLNMAWASGSLGRYLIIGAAAPLLVTGVVAFITKRSQSFIHPGVTTDPATPRDPVHTLGLTEPGFWRSPHVGHRLGLAHTAAAFAVTGHVLASVGEAVPGLGVPGWWRLAFIAVLVAAGAAILLLGRLRSRWYTALLVVSLAGVAAMILMLVGADATALPGQAPGARRLAGPLTWVTVVAGVVFAAGQVRAVTTDRARSWAGRLFNAMSPVALMLMGTGLVHAVGSGMLIQFANLLGDGMDVTQWEEAGTGSADAVVYTDFVGATAVVTVVTLAAVVLATVAMAAWEFFRRERSHSVAASYAKHGEEVDVTDPTTRSILRRIGIAQALASLTDRVAAIIGIAVAAGTVMTLWGLLDPDFTSHFGPTVQQAASTVLALLPIAGIVVINRSSRSPGVRRGIGILWDIATFWPRWFHPFAPPPYGERAVPQLAQRIATILDSGGTVVLSAHSQGSVVGAAAIAVLDARRGDGAGGVTFLTHGSPLGRLYGRFFRRYFDDALLFRVAAVVGTAERPGWINLHRKTDFIGGAVFSGEVPGYVDEEILDPPTVAVMPGEPLPKPRSHFNYTDDEAYDIALARLVR